MSRLATLTLTLAPLLLVAPVLGAQESEPASPEAPTTVAAESEDRGSALLEVEPGALDAPVVGLRLLGLDGEEHAVGLRAGHRGAVLVFLAPGCPASIAMLAELERLAVRAAQAGFEFYGVLSTPDHDRSAALAFRDDHGLSYPVLVDSSGSLASALQPRHTPEAFVLGRRNDLLYRGRVDDRLDPGGQVRATVSSRELMEAIALAARGVDLRVTTTESAGTPFVAWDPAERTTTYTEHVEPVLRANCLGCHRTGEVAPFALESYADAARRARMIAAVAEDRYMPPWHASVGYNHFAEMRVLSDEDIEVLRQWVEDGTPEGPAEASLPLAETPTGWRLGEPDLVLTMPEPFEVAADGPDRFQCFVLPVDIPEDKMVVATEFKPGAPEVLHHAIYYLDDARRGRKLDEADPEPGYSQFGGIGFAPSGSLGGWAPGAQPYFLPDGIGRRLRKGSDLILQVHYHPSGRAQADQSRLALYFADREETVGMRRLWPYTIGTMRVDIPPGEANHVIERTQELRWDVDVIGVIPHMHWLGKSMELEATLPDGETLWLIKVDEYDFNWQTQYVCAEPVRLPRGTKLALRAVYDNSEDNPRNPNSPPRRVRYGEETTDEMCFCFLNVVASASAD